MERTAHFKKPTVPYTLFVYRNQLAIKDKRRAERLAKTKYTLTEELIAQTFDNILHCSVDDLEAISLQMQFKERLLSQIQRVHQLKKLGIKNAYPDMPSTDL